MESDRGPASTDESRFMLEINFVWLFDWLYAAFERHLDAE